MFRIQIAPWKPMRCLGVFFAGILFLDISWPAQAQNADLDACLTFDRAACDGVLQAEPDNLTALFMRGLAAELEGDDAAALKDFDATATKEPRHFGAQLWRQVAAVSLGQSRKTELKAYLDSAKQLGPWPRVLAEFYLNEVPTIDVMEIVGQQKGAAAAEATCAAFYHFGRLAYRRGNMDAAKRFFKVAVDTGQTHVFEYQAAKRAMEGMN